MYIADISLKIAILAFGVVIYPSICAHPMKRIGNTTIFHSLILCNVANQDQGAACAFLSATPENPPPASSHRPVPSCCGGCCDLYSILAAQGEAVKGRLFVMVPDGPERAHLPLQYNCCFLRIPCYNVYNRFCCLPGCDFHVAGSGPRSILRAGCISVDGMVPLAILIA